MTTQELESIISYSAGICLCGHGETCSVCDRDQHARNFEVLAKRAAKELLVWILEHDFIPAHPSGKMMNYLEEWFGMQQADKSGVFAAKLFEPAQVWPGTNPGKPLDPPANEVTNAE